MDHLNTTGRDVTAFNQEQFNFSAVMNILEQFEWKAIGITILISILITLVDGHGRLFDPPSRSTAWRVGFDTPKDYNDMEGFCGGFDRQWLVNAGKCGVCGDPYDEMIKPHEAPGGLFATGTIVRNYRQGQIIPVTIQITATHRGFYEFRLCPNNNPKQDPTQECFEKYPLNFINNMGTTMAVFSLENLIPATYQLQLQLPPDVTCSQCIIQWTYVTGNRWGVCSDGTSRLGCGPQESFRACSDVAISPKGGSVETISIAPPPTTTPTPSTTPEMILVVRPTTTTITTNQPTVTTIRSTTLALTSIPSTEPTTRTPTRRPVRPNRPVRPGRPTRPMRPIRPSTVKPVIQKPPVVVISPIVTRPPITRPTPLIVPPGFGPSTQPTVIRPSTQSTTNRPTSSTKQPIGLPDSNGKCKDYVPVASQNTPGMVTWCNNNCRLGYCPPDFCKCAQ